jgi:hypothetical protein
MTITQAAVPSRFPLWMQHAMDQRQHCEIVDDEDLERVPRFVLWWPALTAWWGDCETPQSGRLVMMGLKRSGLDWPQAWWTWKAWQRWGCALDKPHLGAIALVHRYADRCGAIGMVAGRDDAGRLTLLVHLPDRPIDLIPVEDCAVRHFRWPIERIQQLPQYRLPWLTQGPVDVV